MFGQFMLAYFWLGHVLSG